MLALPRDKEASQGYLLLATAGGKVKRSALAAFVSAAGKGVTNVIGLDQGDWVVGACATTGDEEILLVTQQGKGIRFAQEQVRPMGLPAAGVGAIRLAPGDVVMSLQLIRQKSQLFTLTTKGWAKLVSLANIPAQKRYGNGIIIHKVSRRNGDVAVAHVLDKKGSVIVLTVKGRVERLALKDIPRMGRTTLGKPVVAIKEGDEPTAVRNIVISASVKAT